MADEDTPNVGRLEILHFESFLSAKENPSDTRDIIQRELVIVKQLQNLQSHEYSREMDDAFQQYNADSKETQNGNNGKTAQFWFKYIKMMHPYYKYSQSIRVGDLDAYIACLLKITDHFALNHPNYARWTVKYHDNLLRLPETHPEVCMRSSGKVGSL